MIIEIVILSSKTFLPTLREHRAAQNSLKESLNHTSANPFNIDDLQYTFLNIMNELKDTEEEAKDLLNFEENKPIEVVRYFRYRCSTSLQALDSAL